MADAKPAAPAPGAELAHGAGAACSWPPATCRQEGRGFGPPRSGPAARPRLEKDRLHLYLAFEERPSKVEIDLFRALMKRRGDREPLQYLVGEGRFMGLRLKLDKRALIPRPETEALAQRLRALVAEGASGADVGTGSGCLAPEPGPPMAWRCRRPTCPLTRSGAGARENAAPGLDWKGSCASPRATAPGAGGGPPLDLLGQQPALRPRGRRRAGSPEVGGPRAGAAPCSAGPGARPFGIEAACSWGRLESLRRAGAWLALECGEGQPCFAPGRRGLAPPATGPKVKIEADPFGVPRFLLAQGA